MTEAGSIPGHYVVATFPLPRDYELRAILARQRTGHVLNLRTFGPPSSPALLRFPDRNGLMLPASDIPALVEALALAEQKARELGWLEARV